MSYLVFWKHLYSNFPCVILTLSLDRFKFKFFFKASKEALDTTQPPIQWEAGAPSRHIK
jgi:hypothetical protein